MATVARRVCDRYRTGDASVSIPPRAKRASSNEAHVDDGTLERRYRTCTVLRATHGCRPGTATVGCPPASKAPMTTCGEFTAAACRAHDARPSRASTAR